MMNDPPRTEERYRPSPKVIVGAIIAILALVFVFQNTDKKTVNFLWMDFNAAGVDVAARDLPRREPRRVHLRPSPGAASGAQRMMIA